LFTYVLAAKHHTSKLENFGDLDTVETFGFRGEALSSLCAVGKLTIVTRHKVDQLGTRLEFDHNGQIIRQTPESRPIGTTTMLETIFSTLPVRQKELKRNIKREFAKLVQILQSYGLAATGVRISAVNFKSDKNTVGN
jgi:DNA mismatch repair protein PMS2